MFASTTRVGLIQALSPVNNPYRAPNSQAAVAGDGNRPSTVVLVASLLLSVCTALSLSFAVPHFQQTLSAFGAELPLLTRLVLNGYFAIWLLPAWVLGVWLFWPVIHQRRAITLSIALLGLVVVLPVCLIALYLPIFKLAAVT